MISLLLVLGCHGFLCDIEKYTIFWVSREIFEIQVLMVSLTRRFEIKNEI